MKSDINTFSLLESEKIMNIIFRYILIENQFITEKNFKELEFKKLKEVYYV